MKTIIYFYNDMCTTLEQVLNDITDALNDEYGKGFLKNIDDREFKDQTRSVWQIKVKNIDNPGNLHYIRANAIFGACIHDSAYVMDYINFGGVERHGLLIRYMMDYINKLKDNDLVPQPFFQPKIKKVIFNEPATIVLWNDDTKTVVKCSDKDIYNKETGLAMCICKKLYGNDNMFHKVFNEWIPNKEEPKEQSINPYNNTFLDCETAMRNLRKRVTRIGITLGKPYKRYENLDYYKSLYEKGYITSHEFANVIYSGTYTDSFEGDIIKFVEEYSNELPAEVFIAYIRVNSKTIKDDN